MQCNTKQSRANKAKTKKDKGRRPRRASVPTLNFNLTKNQLSIKQSAVVLELIGWMNYQHSSHRYRVVSLQARQQVPRTSINVRVSPECRWYLSLSYTWYHTIRPPSVVDLLTSLLPPSPRNPVGTMAATSRACFKQELVSEVIAGFGQIAYPRSIVWQSEHSRPYSITTTKVQVMKSVSCVRTQLMNGWIGKVRDCGCRVLWMNEQQAQFHYLGSVDVSSTAVFEKTYFTFFFHISKTWILRFFKWRVKKS